MNGAEDQHVQKLDGSVTYDSKGSALLPLCVAADYCQDRLLEGQGGGLSKYQTILRADAILPGMGCITLPSFPETIKHIKDRRFN